MEIYKNNEINVKLNSKITDTKQINRGVRQGFLCPPRYLKWSVTDMN
jgi:hypothetical protein